MEEPLVAGSIEKTGELKESLVVTEIKKQLYLAGPLIAGCLLQNVVQMISVMFVGHLGWHGEQLGHTLWTSLRGKTVPSSRHLQAEGNRRAYPGERCGCHNMGIHREDSSARRQPCPGAGSYIRWLTPALFVYGLLQCHVRFLQTQNIVLPVMMSSGVTALNHVLVCWLLVYKLGLGNKGAALANAISYLTNASILAIYIRVSPTCKNTWTGVSKEAFHDLFSFMRLAVPSALMVCLEWWSFELLVLLSGLLPNPKLEASVLSICLNTGSLVFMIPLGLGAAISTWVSNELGAGRPQAARLATRVTMVLGLVTGVFLGIIIILMRNLWGYAYSNEKEVVEYISRMLPILGMSFVFDDLQCVLSGVVRGCGLQKIGACVNLSAYYLVGIPAALCFAFFFHFGGMGLWFGIVCGLLVQMLLLLSITLCTNWEKEATKAKDRVFSSSLPLDMTT